MPLRPVLFVLSLVLALTCTEAFGQKTLTASKAWIKAPAAGETSAAAFVLIENPTMYDVYVVSAVSDVAGAISFVKGDASGGALDVVEQLTAPAYDSVELKAGGVYLRLTDLKKPLKPGDKVTIVLSTDNGMSIEAVAEVKAAP